METQLYSMICGFISISALILNLFLILCLWSQPGIKKEGLKQPLKLLLWSTVGSSTLLQTTAVLSVCLTFFPQFPGLNYAVSHIFYFSTCTIFSSGAWLSFFYYLTIVPNQRAFFTWAKKSIRLVVSWGLIVHWFIILGLVATKAITSPLRAKHGLNLTATAAVKDSMYSQNKSTAHNLEVFCMTSFSICLIISLLTKGASCTFTLVYLRRHIKAMETSKEAYSLPQLRCHMRITITGVVQAGLYFPCCLWVIMAVCCHEKDFYQHLDKGDNITNTLIALFCFGNCVCISFCQSVFRKRAASLFGEVLRVLRSFQMWGL